MKLNQVVWYVIVWYIIPGSYLVSYITVNMFPRSLHYQEYHQMQLSIEMQTFKWNMPVFQTIFSNILFSFNPFILIQNANILTYQSLALPQCNLI